MKYAKLINGYPQFAPNPILINDVWIGNPPGEVYRNEGYKPVVFSDVPGDAPEGWAWKDAWVEEDGNIQQVWVLVEIPISEGDALIRYSNELTGSNDETLEEAAETLIKTLKEVN